MLSTDDLRLCGIRCLAVTAALLFTAAKPAYAQTEPGARSAADTAAALPDGDGPRTLDAWRPSVLTNTRYDEHWEQMKDEELRDKHWTGRFKYISIAADVFLTTGIELRARQEKYRGNGWGGAPAPDDGYIWLRALPYADLRAGSGTLSTRFFIQPMATYAIGVAPTATGIDQSRLDILQGFADVRIGAVNTGSYSGYGGTVRYGRQMISLGSERLVGTRYGPNVPLAFDGFRGLLSASGAVVTVLAVRPVAPGLRNFDDRTNRRLSLWGAYATIPHVLGSGLDLYYLGYRRADARYADVRGRELRHTIGARVFGSRTDGWHWNLEGMIQTGKFAGADIGAWALALDAGRKLSEGERAVDVTLRANVTSGDRHPADDRLGTFNPLFPSGKYFGELSPVGPINLLDVNPRVTIPLSSGVSLGVMGNAYWRYSKADGVYDVPGFLLRAPGGSTARFIGKQADLALSWQATPELELSGSLSAFLPGDFIRQTGSSRTIVMFGTEANFRF